MPKTVLGACDGATNKEIHGVPHSLETYSIAGQAVLT